MNQYIQSAVGSACAHNFARALNGKIGADTQAVKIQLEIKIVKYYEAHACGVAIDLYENFAR